MSKSIVCRREECDWYLDRDHPMKMTAEVEEAWNFVCQRCYSIRIITKDKVGGTRGAGQRADGTRSVVGRGF